ncbi:MAG: hypothetical protein ACRBBO_15330 [Cognatishimia sp.]
MNLKSTIFPVTGVMKPAGPLAEGGLLAALGPFLRTLVGSKRATDHDAQGLPHTHDLEFRAPETPPEPVFNCPLWPACDCPGGAVRPECPALEQDDQ